MRCQLSRLQKGQLIDEWFPLSSHFPLKGIEPGSLRVRARYSLEKIMPEEEYSEFKEVFFLLFPALCMCIIYIKYWKITVFSKCLNMCSAGDIYISKLWYLCSASQHTSPLHLLFRGNATPEMIFIFSFSQLPLKT